MNKTDCYFYNEDYNMGATIKTCGYDPDNWVWGKCECFNCQNYLSKEDINKIVRKYLKEINSNDK